MYEVASSITLHTVLQQTLFIISKKSTREVIHLFIRKYLLSACYKLKHTDRLHESDVVVLLQDSLIPLWDILVRLEFSLC